MKALFRYPGAKWALAEWIIQHFPPGYENMVYLEPFCGSSAVFFNKEPSVVETINDLNSDIVNLFRVLREQPDDLQRAMALTPYSREEYDNAFNPADDPVEKARRFMVQTTQAIGAKMCGKCGWRNHKQTKVGGTACKWYGIPDTIGIAAERLKGTSTHLVQIEHMDAIRLIERYDSPEVLMYLDPPYVRSTRKSGKLYQHEMNNAQQADLLALISKSRAKVIISGYKSSLYDEFLSGWYCDSIMARTTSAALAEEKIWMNYEPSTNEQLTFLDEEWR